MLALAILQEEPFFKDHDSETWGDRLEEAGIAASKAFDEWTNAGRPGIPKEGQS